MRGAAEYQDLVTVVATADTAAAYAYPDSTCRVPAVMGAWVTPPSETLSVKVEHPAGELASNGWPLSCTDIRVTPLNGTAPYSLLVAPAYHPPLQFSGNGALNYTVRLSHGQAFMLGLFDAQGNSWAYGPLHAGHNDDVACLAVNNGYALPSAGGVGVGVLAGGVVGAFVVGALGAVTLLWGCCLRGTKRRRMVRPLNAIRAPYSLTRPSSPCAAYAYTDLAAPTSSIAHGPRRGRRLTLFTARTPDDVRHQSAITSDRHRHARRPISIRFVPQPQAVRPLRRLAQPGIDASSVLHIRTITRLTECCCVRHGGGEQW